MPWSANRRDRQALPGDRALIDLNQVVFGLDRLVRQQQPGTALLKGGRPAGIDPALSDPGPLKPIRKQVAIPLSHRAEPLQVVTIAPGSGGNGRLVVISHGLGDDPVNFEGWAAHLASHGYTVLQLAGVRPSATLQQDSCANLRDPDRNLSWVLQCSFLTSANRAGGADSRIVAAVAVSPPMRLLFDEGAGKAMNGRVLLVSGSRDWVVSAGPEATTPMALESRNSGGGHRLVLVQGGDHFNLRSTEANGGGPLRGLLLTWTEGAFAAGPAAAPGRGAPAPLSPDGWGDSALPMVDVTTQLPPLARP
jgi:predicted dienelactone hydrolase